MGRFQRICGYLLLTAGAAACSTAPVKVASLTVATNAKKAYALISAQAKQCWQTDASPIRVGILLSGGAVTESQYVIHAYPVHWSGGVEHKAFATVTIDQGAGGSVISVDEGANACSLSGCHTLGLVDDVKHWVVGDMSCKDIKGALTREGIGI